MSHILTVSNKKGDGGGGGGGGGEREGERFALINK